MFIGNFLVLISYFVNFIHQLRETVLVIEELLSLFTIDIRVEIWIQKYMYVNENNSILKDRHLNTCIMWYFWFFRLSTMCMRRACTVLWAGTCGRCYPSVSRGRTMCGPITRSWWTSGPRRRSGPCVQWTKVWTFHRSIGINRMSITLKPTTQCQ